MASFFVPKHPVKPETLSPSRYSPVLHQAICGKRRAVPIGWVREVKIRPLWDTRPGSYWSHHLAPSHHPQSVGTSYKPLSS